MENRLGTESPPILVEPFVPPPRPSSPSRAPAVHRVLIRSPTQFQYPPSEHSPRTILVQSPHSIGSPSSQSTRELTSTERYQPGSPSPERDYPISPKRRVVIFDPILEERNGRTISLPNVSSNASSPLLTPPTPRRQQSIATQLPTVPIPPSPTDRSWSFMRSGFMSKFEPIPVQALFIHTILCFAAFPFIYLLCVVASGRDLFWTRAIVGAVCGLAGLALGYNLLDLAQQGMESALWATIIHESMRPDGGVTLEQLDSYVSRRGSPWATFRLLSRIFRHKGARRTNRRKYDQTPWTFFIILFLFVAIISTCLVFIFGRIVEIYTRQERQMEKYRETIVMGDLSEDDIARAGILSEQAYSNFNITWSLTPFASAGLIPMGRSFTENRLKLNPQAVNNVSDTICPRRHGIWDIDNERTPTFSGSGSPVTESRGQVLRWPRWGIRIGCMVLDNLDKYLVPMHPTSGMTYLFVPKTTMSSILESMDIPYPDMPPVDFSEFMEGKDKPPKGISQSDIAVKGKWWPNGVAHAFESTPAVKGEDGTGWLQIELVLVRLNRAYAENSSFPVKILADKDYPSPVGYDAAICVEEFKPYMVDAYNNTAGSPITLGLVHRSLDFDRFVSTPEKTVIQDGVQWGINSTGKYTAYALAHENSRNIIIKDNGRDYWYVPNPTLVSFTNGSGPLGYTKLDPTRLAMSIAKSDSQHLLPYLAGSHRLSQEAIPTRPSHTSNIPALARDIIAHNANTWIHCGYIRPTTTSWTAEARFWGISWLAAIEGRYEHLAELKQRGKDVKVRYTAPDENDWTLS
ncbi:hypothetical protein RhiJN_12399 [Ceratobasidium sp. AG-Ba]|nr:hypothetical protein RhiJN_12399 [Ceratobasidium sp. AG-Ba]